MQAVAISWRAAEQILDGTFDFVGIEQFKMRKHF
jgi:hypothetical protein